MRKFLTMLLVLVLVLCTGPIFAAISDDIKGKLVVSEEWNMGEKNIENLNALNIGLGSTIDGSIGIKTDDVEVNQYLTTIGYKLSDTLVPYAVLGYSQLGLDQTLNGSIRVGGWSGSADLTASETREGAFTYGAGATGKLATIKGVDLGYDARYVMFSVEETDEALMLAPDYFDLGINNKQNIDYAEAALSLIASKEIIIKEAKTQDADGKWRNAAGEYTEAPAKGDNLKPLSVTPYAGYRLSRVDINKKNDLSYGPVSASTETNLNGINNVGLIGASAKITESIDIAAGAVIDENIGMEAKATYNF
jgi:hypothetical protein